MTQIRFDGITESGDRGSVFLEVDANGNLQTSAVSSTGVAQEIDAEGNAKVTQGTHLPGARNETSETIDYVRTLSTGNGTRADTGVTETVITASPAVLIAVIGNALTAGTSSIRNAAATGGGSTPVLLSTFADGLSARIGIEFDTGITIQGSDALHDVTIIWGDL